MADVFKGHDVDPRRVLRDPEPDLHRGLTRPPRWPWAIVIAYGLFLVASHFYGCVPCCVVLHPDQYAICVQRETLRLALETTDSKSVIDHKAALLCRQQERR